MSFTKDNKKREGSAVFSKNHGYELYDYSFSFESVLSYIGMNEVYKNWLSFKEYIEAYQKAKKDDEEKQMDDDLDAL